LAEKTHWTGVTLHGFLRLKLTSKLSYRTIIGWLHELDVKLRLPRPWTECQNKGKQAHFRAELEKIVADPEVEIWFGDEGGFEGDPWPSGRWVERGSRPTVPYRGDHIRQIVIGAVCPDSG